MTGEALWLQTEVTVCPNAECKVFAIEAALYKAAWSDLRGQYCRSGDPLLQWRMRPQSSAKLFPSYIPQPLLDDYEEACAIRDLSPKASATLARRCLQGLIRVRRAGDPPALKPAIQILKAIADSTAAEFDVWRAPALQAFLLQPAFA